QPFTLDCGAAANDAVLDLSREGAGGDFTFTLDASNPATPVLTVAPAGAPPQGTPGDVTPPAVTITGTMPGGMTLSNTQVIAALASDAESPLLRVEFNVDDELLWVDSTAPFEAPWDTEAVANGDHVLTATAFDAAGNQADSAPLTVTVQNIGPYGVDMYPRGSWDPNFDLLPGQLPMDYLGSGVYRSTLTLADGSFRYKIASDDFEQDESNCNPPVDNTPAILTVPLEFTCSAQSGNARFDVSLEPVDTDYTFELDASRSIVNPLATASRADAGPPPVDGDDSPPVFTTALTLDPSGATVEGSVIINASVTDDNAVASVTFLVDNEVIWSDFTPPFQAPWDSTLTENGTRTVTALAEDANGNVGGSAPLSVVVDNPDFGPFAVPMFVRGGFVDDPDFQFGTTHQIALLQDGGSVYEVTVNIDRAEEPPTEFFIGFKVADAGWTEGTNCGVGSATTVGLGVETEMICSAADNNDDPTVNITLNLLGQPQPADYTFTIDATGFPTTRPTVTVTAGD
ncbi:MAG: Ig-like domain-containing protein, partial [Pseudomonadota bacterium]